LVEKGKVGDPFIKFCKLVKKLLSARVTLFGSGAGENALKTGDYDFHAVSESFKNV